MEMYRLVYLHFSFSAPFSILKGGHPFWDVLLVCCVWNISYSTGITVAVSPSYSLTQISLFSVSPSLTISTPSLTL